MSLLLPNDSQRHLIVGRTGSGKTQAAVWSLSQRSIDIRPWIIFNYKGDELIDDIPRSRELELSDKLPKEPGVYIVRPLPDSDPAQAEFLWRVHARGGIGLYIDEGYMLGNQLAPHSAKAFRAILTQGRSKRIPAITLGQRPVWLDRFAFSESEMIQVFHLSDARDQKTAQEFVPAPFESLFGSRSKAKLPDYHSVWHNVARHETCILRPVPERASILATFDERLAPRRRVI